MDTASRYLEALGSRLFELLKKDAEGRDLQGQAYLTFLRFCIFRGLHPITNCADRLEPTSWFQAWGAGGERFRFELTDFIGPMLDPPSDREGQDKMGTAPPIFPGKGNGPRS